MVRVHITQLLLAAPALSHCTQMVPPPLRQSNSVRPADASGMHRDMGIPFMTLAGNGVCQESENQTIDLPDLKKHHHISLKVWEFGGAPQSNLTLQVISHNLAAFFLGVFGGYHFMTLPRPKQTVD